MTYIEPLPYPTDLNPFKAGQLPLRQGATEEGGNKNGDKTKKPTKKRKEMRTAARSTTEGQVAVSFARQMKTWMMRKKMMWLQQVIH